MGEDQKKWEEEVTHAAEEAGRVYDDQVADLERDVEGVLKGDERTAKHVEHQVEVDGALAGMHIDHAEHVVEHQVERVEKADEAVAKRVAEGKSDASIARAEKHAERVEASAEKRVEDILEAEAKHLERDAEAAVKHVAKGVDRAGDRDDELSKKLDAAADKVADAFENVVKKADD